MQKFKRKVFYLGGFDPRGVRFYHQLYRDQAARYTALTGEAVAVSARRAGPANSALWTVTNASAGVETDYEYLRWEDLIGKVWIRHPFTLAWRAARAYAGHARLMQFGRMRKLRRGPVITILYPPILAILIPLLLALVPALLLSLLLPFWAGRRHRCLQSLSHDAHEYFLRRRLQGREGNGRRGSNIRRFRKSGSGRSGTAGGAGFAGLSSLFFNLRPTSSSRRWFVPCPRVRRGRPLGRLTRKLSAFMMALPSSDTRLSRLVSPARN